MRLRRPASRLFEQAARPRQHPAPLASYGALASCVANTKGRKRFAPGRRGKASRAVTFTTRAPPSRVQAMSQPLTDSEFDRAC